MNYESFNIPCVTCQASLKSTLRPTKQHDFYYCIKCEACYEYIVITDIFGKDASYLNPVTPGRREFSRAADDGVNYSQHFTVDSTYQFRKPTQLPEYLAHDYVMGGVQPPRIEPIEIPDFKEEKDIIKKSNTVKEFLKNSLYLEKPYDKD